MTTSLATDARALAVFLAEQWIEMWNGDHEITALLLAEEFRFHLGGVPGDVDPDHLRGPRQMAVYLDRWRSVRPGVRFAPDGAVAVDVAGPGSLQVVLRWQVQGPLVEPRGGIDWLRVAEGRVAEVWSLTGARSFGG